MQKAFNIRDGYLEDETQITTKTLNEMLQKGWRVIHMCSVGWGYEDVVVAFVILETK